MNKHNKYKIQKALPLTVQHAACSELKARKKLSPYLSINKYQSDKNPRDTFYRPISKM